MPEIGGAVCIGGSVVADAPALLALQRLCYRSEAALYGDWAIPPLAETLPDLLAAYATQRILAARDGTRLVGSVRAREADGVVAIGRLIVHPAFQRHGIGASLMAAIERRYPPRFVSNCSRATAATAISGSIAASVMSRIGAKQFPPISNSSSSRSASTDRSRLRRALARGLTDRAGRSHSGEHGMALRIGEAKTNDAVTERLRPGDWRPTMIAASLSALAAALLIASFSGIGSAERPAVVASMIDGVRWLASAAIAAGATVAALNLTTLGLLDVFERRGFGPRFLLHMRLTVLGAFATIAFAVAALVLSLFPTATGGDRHPEPWEVETVYYALLALIALIVGGFAVVLTSLYSTIAEVFRNLPSGWVRDILSEESSGQDEPTPSNQRQGTDAG